ncbi:hypothetical protein ACFPES_27220 [Paenibacillus sp. GCM10023248]|uniref:hypothetical protein n=1 Tax=Bacillales TaxID=1385 RepID=UPI002379AFC5|nr:MULTISPECIES: hypothetical protein [Bacillales]MDD9270755.1 hypothetical protein [Paenibacillus sp. MAHUQ-63]MDR6883332.1 hypothetical protein [Bacillus sp. 3255]
MIDKNVKSRAVAFVKSELERVLRDLESGIITRDQAVGSLNTLFNLSSGIEDPAHMQLICRITAYIRTTNFYGQLKKMYANKFFHEFPAPAPEEVKEVPAIKVLEKIVR